MLLDSKIWNSKIVKFQKQLWVRLKVSGRFVQQNEKCKQSKWQASQVKGEAQLGRQMINGTQAVRNVEKFKTKSGVSNGRIRPVKKGQGRG